MSAHARVHLPLTWLRWSDESRSESASGEERVVLGWFLDRRMGGLVNESWSCNSCVAIATSCYWLVFCCWNDHCRCSGQDRVAITIIVVTSKIHKTV